MTPDDAERFREVRRIAEAAFELDANDRDAFVAAECDGDPELRRAVDELLAADALDTDLSGLVRDEIMDVTGADLAAADLAGTRIGRFLVRRLIGAGGMGSVYEAEQDEPRRTVALKTLGAGLLGPDAIARFRIEAEVLARLDHPAIASVFEAGTHRVPSGDGSIAVPYFAMEFVRGGRTLVEYARAEALTQNERLSLFGRVCAAVHHGHLNGVIHRDLKPANILVDEDGQPKVIDFGVARASDADASLRTRTGELIGTLQYMSPEQVEGVPESVDARSDVYALGAVLFELVSGQSPHLLEGLSLTEVIRVLSGNPPRRLRAVLPTCAPELEWITGKALETDKERRYASAAALALDVERLLTHEPVSASPPSTLYRARKFVRRNRLGVAVAAVFLSLLIGGLVTVTLGLARETQQRRRAEATSAFMNSIFAALSPDEQGVDARVIDLIDDASTRLEEDPPGEPLVEADLRMALGSAYRNLSRYGQAEPHLRRAAELRDGLLEEDDPDLARTWASFAKVLPMNSKPDEAEAATRRALELLERNVGPRDYGALDMLCLLSNVVAMDRSRLDEATTLARRAVDLHPPRLTRPTYSMIRALEVLAHRRSEQDSGDDARVAFEAMVAVRAALSGVAEAEGIDVDADPLVDRPFADRPDTAVDILVDVLRIEEEDAERTGDNRPLVDAIREANNFGHSYFDWGRPEKALELFEAIAPPSRRLHGEDGDLLGNALLGIGMCHAQLGRPDLAVDPVERVLTSRLRILGREHWQTWVARWHLIESLVTMREWAAAEPHLRAAIEDFAYRIPSNEQHIADVRTQHGIVLRELDRFEEAETVLKEAYDQNLAERPDHHNFVWPIIELVRLYSAWDKPDLVRAWDAKVPARYKKGG